MRNETPIYTRPWWVVAAAGLFLSTATASAQTPPSEGTSGSKHEASSKYESSMTTPGVDLRMAMRKLWEDHIAYTHNYIISALGDQPDRDAITERLLTNQDDIGNAIKPYYGDAAAKKLSSLLRDHIVIATDVVKAAKAGDKNELGENQKKWSANGKEIAAFLSDANPNWPKNTLEQMLQKHLDLLTRAVVGRLNQDWKAEIKANDDNHAHVLMLADALTDGIAKQFPDKFKGSGKC